MARQPALDAARTNGTILVIATHAALSFMVTPIGWAIQDRSQHLGVDLAVWILRAFGMPTFFWLSGYAARGVLDARGVRGYAWNRVARILVPLAVALAPCSLAIDALWDWGREASVRVAVPTHIPKLEASELPLQLAHLWYLYDLLWLSLAALVVVRLVRGRRAPTGLWLLAVPAALAIAALSYLRALQTNTPLGFAPNLPLLVYMGAFFAWGWLVHARPDELVRYGRHAWRALALAGGLLAIAIDTLARGAGAIDAPPIYAIAASGAFTIAMIVFFLGVHVRYRARAGAGFFAEAAYWSYIVHLPVVVALQIALADVAIPGVLKYALILAATMAACLASYAAVRRLRNTSRISAPHR